MYYKLGEQLIKCEKQEHTDLRPIIEVITLEEWKTRTPFKEMNRVGSYEAIQGCKVETYKDRLYGMLSIPVKHDFQRRKRFMYYAEPNYIVFIDDAHLVISILDQMALSKIWKNPSMERFWASFLETLVHLDLQYLEELENRLSKIEDAVSNGDTTFYNHKMMPLRKELIVWHWYYAQLTEMGQKLQENEVGIFAVEEVYLFDLFVGKIKGLHTHAQMLREYSLEIREVYQSQIDIKQNKIMKVLTVVTTIFMPLTLITGWYGMNFTYMPELEWYYSYPIVSIISLIVVGVCIYAFKRKKFL